MIKSLLKKYISKYFTDSRVEYSIFNRSVDIYNTSFNKEFFNHIHSQISHVHYNFTLDSQLVVINGISLSLSDLNILMNNQGSPEIKVEINNLIIFCNSFEIKILKILNNQFKNIKVYYKKTKLFEIDEIFYDNVEFNLKNIKGKYDELFKIQLSEFSKIFNYDAQMKFYNETSDCTLKCYSANIKKLIFKGIFFYAKTVLIRKSQKWNCEILKIKYEDFKFDETQIEYFFIQNKTNGYFLKIENDLADLSISYTSDLHLDIFIKKLMHGTSQRQSILQITEFLQNIIFTEAYLNLRFKEYTTTCKLESFTNHIKILNLKINLEDKINLVEMKSGFLSETLLIKDIQINSTSYDNQMFQFNSIDFIEGWQVEVENLEVNEIFCKKLVFGKNKTENLKEEKNKGEIHKIKQNTKKEIKAKNKKFEESAKIVKNLKVENTKIPKSTSLCDTLSKKLNIKSNPVTIEEIQILYFRKLFYINLSDVTIIDYDWCIQMYEKNLNQKSENINFVINIYNLNLIYKNIKLNCAYGVYTKKRSAILLDLVVDSNYLIESSIISLNNCTWLIKHLEVNYSDSLIHRLYETIFSLKLPDFSKNTNMHIQAKYINIRFFENMNSEKYSIYLFDSFIKLFIPEILFNLLDSNIHIEIRKCQIDDQIYNSRHPIIFLSESENIFGLSFINNELYIKLGKFKAHYEDEMINKGCFKDIITFYKKLFLNNRQLKSVSNYQINSIFIEKVDGFLFYKYPLDIKLKALEFKNVSFDTKKLIDNIYKVYKSNITSKYFSVFCKIVKNSFLLKYPLLAYKGDRDIPSINYIGLTHESRIKYPMPMRQRISKYDKGLAVSFYIFNSLINGTSFTKEVFVDGTYACISYRSESSSKNTLLNRSTLDNKNKWNEACLILTTKRVLLSTRLNIKELCLSDLSVTEGKNFFCIGRIEVKVENKKFVNSLCKFLCLYK